MIGARYPDLAASISESLRSMQPGRASLDSSFDRSRAEPRQWGERQRRDPEAELLSSIDSIASLRLQGDAFGTRASRWDDEPRSYSTRYVFSRRFRGHGARSVLQAGANTETVTAARAKGR
jgi:hypothetical protein